MTPPALLVLAHGTADPAGHEVWTRLAARLRTPGPWTPGAWAPVRPGRVSLGYADVRSPTLADALAALPGPVVVVPAFLAAGYHVRSDIPAQLVASGRADVAVAAHLGPDPLLVSATAERLQEAGLRAGDGVVLGAAGSSDPEARAESETAARLLSDRLGSPVEVGNATGTPSAVDAVAGLRARGCARVLIATWLLAPGRFAGMLAERAGADAASAPLGDHPLVAAAIAARYAAWQQPRHSANC